MTTERTTTPTPSPSPSQPGLPPAAAGILADPTPTRVRVAASALALGAITVAGVLVWRPWGDRNAFAYDEIEPLRDSLWIGTLLDGFAFAVVAIALALLTCHLVRARGSRWATTGAVVTSLAGISFAMGSLAHGAVAWFATSDAISVASGTALLDQVEDTPLRVMAPVMTGFLGYTIGSLMLAVALLRARAVPRWLPVGFVVLTAAQFAPVPSRVLDFVQIALMALLVCLAATVLARRR